MNTELNLNLSEIDDIDNQPRLVIMSGNTKVLSIDMDTTIFTVHNELLLPFGLKGKLIAIKDYDYIIDVNKRQRYYASAVRKNSNAITSWLANRILLLSRSNAKKLYQAFRLCQSQDEITKAELAIACRAVSVLDNYWVKLSNENVRWEDINVRCNSLNEAVIQIMLHGKLVSLQGSMITPEFTTNGAYAKAWRRDPDGSLWLYKLNDRESTALIEVMVSNLLDCTNVRHCHYERREDNGATVCACPALTSDNLSIMDGMTFLSYCNTHDIDPDKFLIELDSFGYYSMMIVDYLIANPDRHSQNWGLEYDSNTMEIKRLHSLFDHNNAFSKEVMEDENFMSHFGNRTLKANALNAVSKIDFKFTKEITRDMFLTSKQYECFMKRAKQLRLI